MFFFFFPFLFGQGSCFFCCLCGWLFICFAVWAGCMFSFAVWAGVCVCVCFCCLVVVFFLFVLFFFLSVGVGGEFTHLPVCLARL